MEVADEVAEFGLGKCLQFCCCCCCDDKGCVVCIGVYL